MTCLPITGEKKTSQTPCAHMTRTSVGPGRLRELRSTCTILVLKFIMRFFYFTKTKKKRNSLFYRLTIDFNGWSDAGHGEIQPIGRITISRRYLEKKKTIFVVVLHSCASINNFDFYSEFLGHSNFKHLTVCFSSLFLLSDRTRTFF